MRISKIIAALTLWLAVLTLAACESNNVVPQNSGEDSATSASVSPTSQVVTSENADGNSVLPEGIPAGQYDNLAQRRDGSIIYSIIDTNGQPHAYSTNDAGRNWQEIDNNHVVSSMGMDLSPTSISATVDSDGNWWVAGVKDNGNAAILRIKQDGVTDDLSSAITTSSPFIEEILQDGEYIAIRYSTQTAIWLTTLRQTDGTKVADIELSGYISIYGSNAQNGKAYGFDFSAQKIYEADLTNGSAQLLGTLPKGALPEGMYLHAYTVASDGTFYVVNAEGISRLDGETLSLLVPYVSGAYDIENDYQYTPRASLLVAADNSIWLAAASDGLPCLYRYV